MKGAIARCFPDTTSLPISEPGTDASCAASLLDRTDNRWGQIFAAAGLATILVIGAEFGSGDDEDDVERALRRGLDGIVSETGQRIVDRSLTAQPALCIRAGWPARLGYARPRAAPLSGRTGTLNQHPARPLNSRKRQ